MAKSNFRMLLYKVLLQTKGRQTSSNLGFTLIELLVSIVIAGIVVSGLLFVVVELLRVDQREVALDQVQSDMQRAIDYIADDLKEAIYVYSTPATVTSQLVNLDNDITTNNGVPVLAFWRTDPIEAAEIASLPSGSEPDGCPTGDTACSAIKARRASYTLVAYYQTEEYGAWEGNPLKRYELAQYDDLAAGYDLTPGFTAPFNAAGSANDFAGWTASGTGDDGTRNVLVDYVSAIKNTTNDAPNPVVDCQAFTDDSAHVLSPADATENTGFFACVRPTTVTGTGGFRTNQDVFLFLRGDATPASSFLQPASAGSRLPILQTQIKLGGVIDRDE
ncbi:prepilin-type N-terminal cleavage/methylation domain-containing protein [Leptothoe kymatousa]|uniref:Type II secretion system protein n=1 Tax=Leptothoe kymatousa TAU-MAC 1615 TaxID=2364775 RepID=A0ABS5Y110_9CYAN|nr:prepilin-type N-terminal cleavage/methylation domain-containing protein [Leptothoe kymatousa]MBT9311514.1 type II secretion system protein [Leptothoe kymatousa TAU-MAC 1615]